MGEKIVGTFFALILLYLAVKNATAANNVINAVGNAFTLQVAALQGNNVNSAATTTS